MTTNVSALSGARQQGPPANISGAEPAASATGPHWVPGPGSPAPTAPPEAPPLLLVHPHQPVPEQAQHISCLFKVLSPTILSPAKQWKRIPCHNRSFNQPYSPPTHRHTHIQPWDPRGKHNVIDF